MSDPFDPMSQLAYYTTIPSYMFFDLRIESSAIKCYAIVQGLSRMKGYCYASNQYLAQCLQVSEPSIGRWLRSLKDAGYITIETEKEGVCWKRKIWLSDEFKKCLRTIKNDEGGSSKMMRGVIKNDDICINRRSNNRDIYEGAVPPPSAPPKKEVPFFHFEGKRSGKTMNVKQKSYDELCATYGKAAIDWECENVDIWLQDQKNAKTWDKRNADHTAFFEGWIRRVVARGQLLRNTSSDPMTVLSSGKFPPRRDALIAEAKIYAKKLQQKYGDVRVYISKNQQGKEFVRLEIPKEQVKGTQDNQYIILFEEPGFIDVFKERCRKYGYDLTEII